MLCCAMRAMLGYPDFRSYGWQWVLCRAMRHFLCSNCVAVILLKVWYDDRQDMSLQHNCVAVMLLKARGWRGTSLPRESDNVWFSNPVRVLLLPITWRIRKSWTRSGFISCVHFIPTLASEVSQRGAFKSTTRTELRIWKTTIYITKTRLSKAQLIPNSPFISLCYLTTWSLWWNDRIGIIIQYSINRMFSWVILWCKVSQVTG